MENQIARVSVNGIEVGSLPVDQYHAIVKETRRNKKLYVMQAINMVTCVLKVLAKVVEITPILLVAFLVLLVMLDSQVAQGLIDGIRQADAAESSAQYEF